MISSTNDVGRVVFSAPDPKQNDVIGAARPRELKTPAERDGTGIQVSFSKSNSVMLIDPEAPLDGDKIESIRRQIAEGSFKIDARIVAERAVRF
jgi:anti-sigma28 factor (negative regulator of flagellin synthesis)